MKISEVKHGFDLAAAKGEFPPERVAGATVATVLEAGTKAFHRAYFGQAFSDAEVNVNALKDQARNDALTKVETLISDIGPVYRKLGATLTTTDFPLTLGQVRDRVRRETYNPVESNVFGLAVRRTARDFKALRGIRGDAFSRLKLRPEGANVEYAHFGSTEDLYQIANYELAVPLTWEAWINDDIGEFLVAMESLGRAGRRNRALVVFEAIRDGTVRTTLSGTTPEGSAGAGGPTPANVVALYQELAERLNPNGDPMPRLLTDIAVPAQWTITGRQTLNSQHVVTGADATRVRDNAAFGLANLLVEPMMAEVMGVGASNNAADWFGFDGTQQWLEFATLTGYEAGPRTFTKLPDVLETINEGSFDNHAIAVKVSDNVGAKVTDPSAVVRVAGA